MQDAQAVSDFFNAGLSTPDVEDDVSPELTRGVQIIGIKHEGFALDIKDPPEGTLPFAAPVRVVDVDDVQVASSQDIAQFALGRFQVALALEVRFSRLKLCREFFRGLLLDTY